MLAKTPKNHDPRSPLDTVREIIARVGKSSRLQSLELERQEAMDIMETLREQARERSSDFLATSMNPTAQNRIRGAEYLALLPRVKEAEENFGKAHVKYAEELDGRHARKLEEALFPCLAELAPAILENIAELRSRLKAFDEGARAVASVGGSFLFTSDSLSNLEREMQRVIAAANYARSSSILEKVLER